MADKYNMGKSGLFVSLIKRIVPPECYRRLLDLYVRYRYILYIGCRFECPLCGGHFRKLLPGGLSITVLEENNAVGAGYRVNAVCPRCYSYERTRLLYLYLKNKTGFFNDRLKVLHVAPEACLQRIIMKCPNIDYLSADLSSPLAMVQMDVTNIEYEQNSFDVVICSHVLEHIIDDHKAMSELHRVLKPGGWAIIQVPISLSHDRTYEDPEIRTEKERQKAFGQRDHVRIYARDFEDRLKKVGFSVDVYSFVKEFGDSAVNKYCLLKDEHLYICSKSVS